MGNKIKYSDPLRWGIIGCGDVTEIKSGPAYKLTDGFKLSAVMRRNHDKLQDYAKRHNIDKSYTDATELIYDDEIDAVYIATPPDTHMHYALKVAEAGKPCCIEKPLSPSFKESLIISDYFKSTFKKSGSGTIDTRVDEDYVKKLLGYFKHKGR